MKLKGTFTAMITPFEKGALDLAGLQKNIDFQIGQGVDGILVLGTTGESPTLSSDEQLSVIGTAVEQAAGRVPVMVGTGTNATRTTVEKTAKAKALGANCVLIITPYYNKPTQEGIYRHFKAVAESVEIPIVVYNHGPRTGTNIETETLLRIAELPHIAGVKEASGNMRQIHRVLSELKSFRPDCAVLSGNDEQTYELMAHGGDGAISVISNLLPGRYAQMVRFALAGELEAADRINSELLPLYEALSLETNPIPIKTAMALEGMPAGDFRLPLCEMASANLQKLKAVLCKERV